METTNFNWPENMTITPVGVRLHVGLGDIDWVITCGCGWKCYGDSLNDALMRVGPHVTGAHQRDL